MRSSGNGDKDMRPPPQPAPSLLGLAPGVPAGATGILGRSPAVPSYMKDLDHRRAGLLLPVSILPFSILPFSILELIFQFAVY